MSVRELNSSLESLHVHKLTVQIKQVTKGITEINLPANRMIQRTDHALASRRTSVLLLPLPAH